MTDHKRIEKLAKKQRKKLLRASGSMRQRVRWRCSPRAKAMMSPTLAGTSRGLQRPQRGRPCSGRRVTSSAGRALDGPSLRSSCLTVVEQLLNGGPGLFEQPLDGCRGVGRTVARHVACSGEFRRDLT